MQTIGGQMPPEPALITEQTVRRKVLRTLPTKPRSQAGVEEAKAAAKMTLEEWKVLQKGMREKWPAPAYMSVKLDRRSHTAYRDETYAFVTRWSAETRISYRPHAKSPGSKSHIRYEEYSKARTVGEALELGSWPADWCWDFERGFIKVEGSLRDEPIDITQCTNETELTEVDQAIYKWHNKELARSLGLNYQDLFGTSDSSILRAHRLVALRIAKGRLAEADATGRKISDEDVVATLKAWAFVKNCARGNVIPEGQKWVWSDTIGLIKDRNQDTHVVPASKLYPEVVQLLVRYLIERLPAEVANFTFTSMNLNCNYAARRHRDGNNFGPSAIKAFGEFTGGTLAYWSEDDKSCGVEELQEKGARRLDLSSGPDGGLAIFNGNCAHAVDDFQGNRFSIVYFTAGTHTKAPAEDVAFLKSLGFPYPEPNEDPHAILRAPRGYAQAAKLTPDRERQPVYYLFPNAELAQKPVKRRYTPDAAATAPASGQRERAAKLLKRPASAQAR